MSKKTGCYSIKFKFCSGKLKDPAAEYGDRAYWCAQTGGWWAKPCSCPNKEIKK